MKMNVRMEWLDRVECVSYVLWANRVDMYVSARALP